MNQEPKFERTLVSWKVNHKLTALLEPEIIVRTEVNGELIEINDGVLTVTDRAIRESLIQLGWTPPPEENKKSETPRTDTEVVGDYDQFVYACFARELERELNGLAQWKESAMKVSSEMDIQAVGKLLKLGLGQNIYPQIEPKIRELIAQRDRMAAMLQEACDDPNISSWYHAAQKELKALKP